MRFKIFNYFSELSEIALIGQKKNRKKIGLRPFNTYLTNNFLKLPGIPIAIEKNHGFTLKHR